MPLERWHWLRLTLQLKGSVVPAVLGRTVLCGLFGVLISVLYTYGWPVSISGAVTLIPNIVLGLLLVFRTNTAYDRFWEGRKLWGAMINTVRNLARQIWIAVAVTTPEDHDRKVATIWLLVAFAVATKQFLRHEPLNDELRDLLSEAQFTKLQTMHHPPLEIAFWIGDYLQQQEAQGHLNRYQLNALHKLLDALVDELGGCERILKTPMPLAYAIHLKQLLLLYCLSLPFQLVSTVGWGTGLVVALISFALFGIEEIGIEIENPFGRDPNDLPLDAICATMRRNISDLMSLPPGSERL